LSKDPREALDAALYIGPRIQAIDMADGVESAGAVEALLS